MRKLTFIALLFSFVLFGFSVEANTAYTLDSGDRVKITVFEEEDLSGEFEISSEGELSLPLIGSVHAKGQTLKQVERSILEKLLDGF